MATTDENNKERARSETLIEAVNHLARTVEKRTDQLRRFNYFVVVVLLFMVLIGIWNRGTLTNTESTVETLDSITNPKGELYQRSQLRTREILQYNAIENDCRNRRRNAGLSAPDPGTVEKPRSCTSQTPPEVFPGPTTTLPIIPG